MTIQIKQSTGMAKPQRGYSLIELSIAMAILSVVIVGSLMGVQRILANNRANNVLQSVPRINAALIAGTLGGGGATAVSTNLAAQLGAFDPGAAAGAGENMTVKNEFGGQYRVTANSAAVGNVGVNGGYFVHITNIPQSVCPILANGLAALTDGMWISTDAEMQTPKANIAAFATPTKGNVEASGGSLNIANVATQCSANTLSTLVAFIPMS